MIKNIKNSKVASTIFIDTSCLKYIDRPKVSLSHLDPALYVTHTWKKLKGGGMAW